MRVIVFLIFSILLGFLQSGSAQVGGLDEVAAMGRFLNGALPPRTPTPSTGSWHLTHAFPALTFAEPVQVVPVPRSNRLVVVEKWGRLVMFEDEATVEARSDLLDLRHQTESYTDSGMLGVAFHPEFGLPGSANRHFLYVYYRYTPDPTETDRAYCRLSRFSWDPETTAIDPATEWVLINQYDRHNWHNGGGLFFGIDGFLYLALGDEGGVDNAYGTAQRLDLSFFGGVLRLDVDRDPSRSHPIRRQPLHAESPPEGWPGTFSQGYFIPNDNPWPSPEGSHLEEFFAIGLRSPHRMSQDPVSGEIWVGDVGQGLEEEISKVSAGANLQWPYREGNAPGPKSQPVDLIGSDTGPVHRYGRGTGTCVIGGHTYRGSLHPELVGKYLFADFGSGAIWSLDESGESPVIHPLLSLATQPTGPRSGLAGIGLDGKGEILVLNISHVDLGGCRIFRLEKSTTEAVPEPPPLLSQTGAFSSLSDLTPSAGVMPYGVIQPLWSDGAEKKRWIALPHDGTPIRPGSRSSGPRKRIGPSPSARSSSNTSSCRGVGSRPAFL